MQYRQGERMENIFVIKRFDNDWDLEGIAEDIYLQEEYCIEALQIPDEKIYGTEMIGEHLLEVVLTDIEEDELFEDWYVNLTRISA
jgi:hypothetical protein